MAEYLIIGCKDAVIHSLAVAADIAQATGAQCDIATSTAEAEIARLCRTPRRVVEIAPPSAADLLPDSAPKITDGNWKRIFSFARTAAQNAASTARAQFGQYRELAEEIRLVRYDAVLDLSADAAGLLAAKIANAEKVLGFAAENIPNAAPGASLLYHDSCAISRQLSRREQCRQLAATFFNYIPPPNPKWRFFPLTKPENLPAAPFATLGGRVPEPFLAVLRDAGLSFYTPDSPLEMLAAAKRGEVVAGNGILVEFAAAAGARVLYIGSARDAPPESTATESPSELIQELSAILQKNSAPSAEVLEPESAAANDSESAKNDSAAKENFAAEDSAAANVSDSSAKNSESAAADDSESAKNNSAAADSESSATESAKVQTTKSDSAKNKNAESAAAENAESGGLRLRK